MEDPRKLMEQGARMGPGAPIVKGAKPDDAAIELVSTRQPAEQPKMIGGISVAPDPDDLTGDKIYIEKRQREVEKKRKLEEELERKRDEELKAERARSQRESNELRKRQEQERQASIEADKKHTEWLASPEGRREARAAQLRIEFPGWSEERIEKQLKDEFGPRPVVRFGEKRGLLGLGILPL